MGVVRKGEATGNGKRTVRTDGWTGGGRFCPGKKHSFENCGIVSIVAGHRQVPKVPTVCHSIVQ